MPLMVKDPCATTLFVSTKDFIEEDDEVLVGLTENFVQTFEDLNDNSCGPTTDDRLNTYCCGPRSYTINKETLKAYKEFFTFDSTKKSMTVFTANKEKLGMYPVEIDVALVWYPLVKTKINFDLTITQCNPKALQESYPPRPLWYKVGEPKLEINMPTFS